VFVLSILMVSGLRYSSFKKINVFKPRSMRAFLAMVLIGLMVYIFPQNTLFILFVGYICSGILEYFWRLYRLRRQAPSKSGLEVKMPDDQSWEIRRKTR
jgi:CDP-diacylglycerol--serine O-phosphatidyltransferase